MQTVVLETDTIRLGQLLKLAHLVESGAEVKQLLVAGEVLVNGHAEARRGRQLVRGDTVAVRGMTVRVA